jgi:parallel beta-helix repeat protein
MLITFWKKGLVMVIFILFIGVGIIPSTGTYTQIIKLHVDSNRGNTLYVGGSGPNNYTKIQDAVDNASNGDTVFVFDDSSPYYEKLVVNKSINLIGENKDSTIIDGYQSFDIVYICADGVKVSGFTIQNSSTTGWECNGGVVIGANHTTIIDNNIWKHQGWYGGYTSGILFSSYSPPYIIIHNNTIMHNTISNNDWGIRQMYASQANHNTIANNTISSNNNEGIYLYESNHNIIMDNTISTNNMSGIGLFFDCTSNTICENIILSNKEDGINLDMHSNNNIISENIILSNNQYGINLEGDSNTIVNNNISHNLWAGIHLLVSWNNTIIGNTIFDNSWSGINLHRSTNNNIKENTISFNTHRGIHLVFSHNNTIISNNIVNNRGGVRIEESNDNIISKNTIEPLDHQEHDGIEVCAPYDKECIRNIIRGNTITSAHIGLNLDNSGKNMILNNNFINNYQNALFTNSLFNQWKQNYWSEPRIFPKLIIGKFLISSFDITWFNIDWRPALKPYDRGGV